MTSRLHCFVEGLSKKKQTYTTRSLPSVTYIHSQQCNCLHSFDIKGNLNPHSTTLNNKPVSQVLKQVVNLSCLFSSPVSVVQPLRATYTIPWDLWDLRRILYWGPVPPPRPAPSTGPSSSSRCSSRPQRSQSLISWKKIKLAVVWVCFFKSDAQAKTLGCDIILYAAGKQRGWVLKLGRKGLLPWCER